MTRNRSPTDRRPGFLNAAPTFDVRQNESFGAGTCPQPGVTYRKFDETVNQVGGHKKPCPPFYAFGRIGISWNLRDVILDRRIAGFPAFGLAVIKERVNAVAFAPAEDFPNDPNLFLECVRNPEVHNRIRAAMKHGFQTRETEMALARMLDEPAG